MNSYDRLTSNPDTTAFETETRDRFQSANAIGVSLESIRSRAERGLLRRWNRFTSGAAFRAETRRVRNFDRSRALGRCEIQEALNVANQLTYHMRWI